jgi:Spy/CpxP family protein refolding chaperone
MNRRNILIAALILAGVGLLAYGTWCCLDWMAKRHVHAAHGSLWASETWPKLLSLSQDQRAKIEPLENALKKDLDGLQVELAKDQIALCRAMMSQAKLDPAVMQKAAGRISGLQKKSEEKTMGHLLALREILNPDQQKKLFTTMMRDICQGCRTATGGKKDYCGMCPIR